MSKAKSSIIVNKTFDYSKNGMSLKFTLNTGEKDQLTDFLELLKMAQKDVEAELTK